MQGIKTLILDKNLVDSKYRYFDFYRYSRSENIMNACKHYLTNCNRKYDINIMQVLYVKEFKNTYHVKYEVE